MFYIYTIMELRSLRNLINNMLKVLLYYYQQNDLDMWLFFLFFFMIFLLLNIIGQSVWNLFC